MPLLPSEVPSEQTFEEKLDPNGEIDFTVDWINVLDTLTIANVTNTKSTASDIEFVAETNDDTTATVRIGIPDGSEGSTKFDPPGDDQTFKQTMTDSDGQVWERTFKLTIVNR